VAALVDHRLPLQLRPPARAAGAASPRRSRRSSSERPW
jgi:hypothetical protein